MKLPGRNFLHLAAGAAALSAVPRVVGVQSVTNVPHPIEMWAGGDVTIASAIGSKPQQVGVKSRIVHAGLLEKDEVMRGVPDGLGTSLSRLRAITGRPTNHRGHGIRQHDVRSRKLGWLTRPLHRHLFAEVCNRILRHSRRY
jgi:hypothetical protein